MSTQYSPIDEPSFSDTAYDAEAMLRDNGNRREPDDRSQYAHTHNDQDYSSEYQRTGNVAQAQTQTQAGKAEQPARQNGIPAFRKALRLIRDSRTIMFFGLVLVVLAGYSLIVTISYFAHIGSDQSAMLNSDFDPTMIKNAGGPFGAWIAHTLLYNWLGIGSFMLIYYIAVCGLSMLKVYRASFWNLTLRCLLTAVALSIICGLATYELSSPIYWGGRHGHLLNERLILLSGIWGALAVSIIMGGLVLFLYLTELKRVYGIAAAGISAYRTRQAERRERNEAKRQAEEARRAAESARLQAEEEEKRRIAEQQAAAEEARRMEEKARIAAAQPIYTEPAKPAEPIKIPDETITTPAYDDTNDNDSEAINDSCESDYDIMPLFSNDNNDSTENGNVRENYIETGQEDNTTPAARTAAEVLASAPYDPREDLADFKFPSIDLLRPAKHTGLSVDNQEMEDNKRRITDTLDHYGIPISHIEATVGPTVTLYEIIPAEGVRIAKIKRLEDDIALSLAALGIRIIAPIPGKGTIGIEVPNKDPQIVSMRSIIESDVYASSHMELPMAMGKTISNEVFMADLCKMPHLLVAGATGMGKSVGLNAIITSLLYKKHPAELKFVLIDPKMVEFSLYARLEKHYLAKLPDEEDAIITDPMKVVATLNSLCVEMDNRYALLKEASMRNIKEYNDKFIHRQLNPEKGHRFLPYIVVIVDEFADLIMTAGKEVETPIARIAQKARAVGIHMILATQRPSTNVITGVIKANFPGRVAFRVFQMVDSRTIIDRPGANQLIGRGDMLFSNNGKLDRVQCAFIDTPEVSAICDSISNQRGYPCPYELPEYVAESNEASGIANLADRDPLFEECARLVVQTDTASTSSLQRRYSIGYNRAGKIMDQMEAAGIVGPSQGGKPRQVLIDSITLEHILENN